jgi:hypothetical protein
MEYNYCNENEYVLLREWHHYRSIEYSCELQEPWLDFMSIKLFLYSPCITENTWSWKG